MKPTEPTARTAQPGEAVTGRETHVEPIYHLVLRSMWEHLPEHDYRTASLDTEGFIHCAHARQVAWAANRFHHSAGDLLVLEIDPGRLNSPVKDEAPAGKTERFPHIYGPITRAAVLRAWPLVRDEAGEWTFTR